MAYEAKNYSICLGQLIGCAYSVAEADVGQGMTNVIEKLALLKKAFVKEGPEVNQTALLDCDGPGVMLLHLASNYTVEELKKHTNIFDAGILHKEIELDLRGTIMLIKGHATISCGETKSSMNQSSKGIEQLEVRVNFLKTCVQTIFDKEFEKFTLIGHLFFPKEAKAKQEQKNQNNFVSKKGVYIYKHFV